MKVGDPVSSKYQFRKLKPIETFYGTLSSIDGNGFVTIELAQFEEGKSILSQFLVCKKYHTKPVTINDVNIYNAQLKMWSEEVAPVKA